MVQKTSNADAIPHVVSDSITIDATHQGALVILQNAFTRGMSPTTEQLVESNNTLYDRNMAVCAMNHAQ